MELKKLDNVSLAATATSACEELIERELISEGYHRSVKTLLNHIYRNVMAEIKSESKTPVLDKLRKKLKETK